MVLLERNINERVFKVVRNSLIEESVQAIVNPANTHLAHGGGVAGLISRAGGPEIQRESFAKAPIATGQATYTGAGALPFQYIIHAVGPIYSGGGNDEEKLLYSAVYSALRLADQLQLKSVAMPAISTGIFGYPLEPAIKTIFRAINDFLQQSSSVQEVHLCDYTEEKSQAIKSIIEALL